MKQREEITIQTLANNEDIQIGYSDNDIVVVDSIQQFTEVNTAHVAMNAIVICTNGKVQAQMNGMQMELHKNQVAVIPQNVTVTDVMVSPDFDLKGMFLTNRILQSFLREKMNIWNDMMYIHRQHIVTMAEDEILFYTHFYDMLTLAIAKGKDNPLQTDVIQSLLRSAILALCGAMKWMLSNDNQLSIVNSQLSTGKSHFQRFLDLLHSCEVKHRTVEAYANDLCISPKYLTAVCKKNSGRTANEWITEHVMEDIRFYLKQTDLSIKEICDRLGFPNPSYFGKYVKDHFGLTPLDFRNS
jgi:AraC-like DNA-binding protein